MSNVTLDQLDYMIERHANYSRVHKDNEAGDGSDFELGIYVHQVANAAKIEVLKELRKKFFYDPKGTYPGPLWEAAVAADVESIHKTIDATIAELEGKDDKEEAIDGEVVKVPKKRKKRR